MPDETVVTLTDKQRIAFTEAAAEGQSVDEVLQLKIDEQTFFLRTEQANTWWNSNTLDEKEALVAANQ